jgi:tetratricopeptide (TPR) repeat protein
VEVPAGDGYDFPFEALRRVVVEETTVARRRLLHQRAASALVRRATAARMTAADAGTIARHFHEAGRLDEAAAWHWRAAGEARRLHAHEAALDDVRAALALGHAPAAARLAEGELLVALGHYREAIHALELAAAAADPVSIDAMRVERTLADVHHRLGDYVVADAHLCAALDLVTELGLGDEERAEVLVDRALVACRRGALDTAQQDVEAAHAAANRAGATRSIARASNGAGIVAGRRGDLVTAERAFGDSLVQADRAGDDHTVIAALNNHARVLTTAGRHEEALDLAQQALEQGLRLGDRHRIAALHTNLADVLRAVGRDDESMLHLKQAASTFAGVDDEPLRRPEIWTLVEW